MSNQRSALHKPRLRIAAATLAFAACGTAGADKSQAITGACLEDSTTVRACSDKVLSNVVVQCGDESSSYFVKYDELGDGTFPGLTTPYEGDFTCPTGSVMAVFVKSGRNRYDGPAIAASPAAWSPRSRSCRCGACSRAFSGCWPMNWPPAT